MQKPAYSRKRQVEREKEDIMAQYKILARHNNHLLGGWSHAKEHLVDLIRSEKPHAYPQRKPHVLSFLLKTKAKPFDK